MKVKPYPPNDFKQKFFGFLYNRKKWSEDTFGPPSYRGPLGPARHLEKEAAEVQEAIDKKTPADVLEELSDCFMLVLDANWRAGFSFTELLDRAIQKLEELKTRDYPPNSDPDQPVQHRPVKTQEEMGALGHNLYLKHSPEPKPAVSSFPGWPNGWIGLAIKGTMTGRIHDSVVVDVDADSVWDEVDAAMKSRPPMKMEDFLTLRPDIAAGHALEQEVLRRQLEAVGPPPPDAMTPSILPTVPISPLTQPFQPYRTEPDIRVWENIFTHELISHQKFSALRPPEYRNPFHFLDEFDSWFEFMRRTRFEKESACSVIRDMLSHDITRAAESLDTRYSKIQTKRYDFPFHISNEMIEDDREHLKESIPADSVYRTAAEHRHRKLLDALYTPPFSKEDSNGPSS